MAKLTKRIVDGLKPQKQGDVFIWDGELKGFGVRMKPSGSASFLIQYRTPQGNTRRLSFAKIGTITPEEARVRARRLLAEVHDGQDPSAERHCIRKALTVAELCATYMEAARAGLVRTRFGRTKRSSTIAIDEGRISRHIVPLIGNKIADELTRADVQRMCDAIAAGKTAATIKTKARGVARVTGGAGTATRIAGLLGGIYSWADKRGLTKSPNPVRGLDLRADEARDRILTHEELGRLGQSIRCALIRTPMAANAVHLIALTALRRSEVYNLKWAEIDFTESCLRLRETKTGRSTRPIGKPVTDLLQSLPKLNDNFVFPNQKGTGGADLKRAAAEIFNAAGLLDVRGRDLRRTFASAAAGLGYSDATVGELIGHAKRGVTERHYVRRPDAALVEAATRTAEIIEAALNETD